MAVAWMIKTTPIQVVYCYHNILVYCTMYTYIIYDINITFSLTTYVPVSYHSMLDSEPLSVEVTFQVIPFSLVV